MGFSNWSLDRRNSIANTSKWPPIPLRFVVLILGILQLVCIALVLILPPSHDPRWLRVDPAPFWILGFIIATTDALACIVSFMGLFKGGNWRLVALSVLMFIRVLHVGLFVIRRRCILQDIYLIASLAYISSYGAFWQIQQKNRLLTTENNTAVNSLGQEQV
jgi:hypothetical protein